MQNPRQLLTCWFAPDATVELREVRSGGLSGARIWHVDRAGDAFALRQWPAGMSVDRLKPIHEFQNRLATAGCPVPAPIRTSWGDTFTAAQEHIFELAPWMPGEPDFRSDPRPAKLQAALFALARLHLAEAAARPNRSKANPASASPALRRRADGLESLVRADLEELQRCLSASPAGPLTQLACGTLELVARAAPRLCQRAFRWRNELLSHQWRLCDVKHDHILFSAGAVTGIVDFGAADIDSPTGDVARLLGSMALDDRALWQLGLSAYESVQPLSSVERDAVDFFDASGTVLSAANWIRWIFRDSWIQFGRVGQDSAADRLTELVGRLQIVAASS